MGDYATLRVEGKIKPQYQKALRSFWTDLSDAPAEDAFAQIFVSASPEEQRLVLTFLSMDRARFSLRGALSYAPVEWEREEDKAFKVSREGYLLWLSSSKNVDTQKFFLAYVIPILYEEGYRAALTGLR